MNTSQKLDSLAILDNRIANHNAVVKERRNILDSERDMLIASVLTDEQKIQMEEIKAEFASKYAALEEDSEIKSLEAGAKILVDQIREETLKVQTTVKGFSSTYQCVYTPEKEEDKVTVNTDALKGMAVLMPKLKEIYTVETKISPASTSLRKK